MAALQPHLDHKVLSQPMMHTTDPLIVNNVTNVVRTWAYGRHDLPNDFCELVTIRSISRQPVAFVIVEAEHVARTITSSEVPFSGDSYDARKWPTKDVFELAPLAALSFPQNETLHEASLGGQEELRQCPACAGAGQRACVACGATGQILCPDCAGTRQVVCPTCGGAGTHIGVRGNVIQCQTCRTRGYVRCTRCTGGNLPCNNCNSTGQTLCDSCVGDGSLLRRWNLETRTSSWREHGPYLMVDWQLPIDCLLDDCQEVASIVWTGLAAPELKDALPSHLVPVAERQIEALRQRARSLDARTERLAGMRLRVLAAYLYKVDCDYEGQAESLFLGGLHSRAFTQRGEDRKSTIRGFVRSLSKRLSRPFDKPVVDRGYLGALRAGAVHISDTRRLVPEAAMHARASLETTENGYTLKVPARTHDNPQTITTDVEVSWDVDGSGQLLLCTTLLIGRASQRDRFPQLLSLNQELSFGRLAFHEDSRNRQTQIALLDRRIYETIKASDYSRILTAMACEARELRAQEAFR